MIATKTPESRWSSNFVAPRRLRQLERVLSIIELLSRNQFGCLVREIEEELFCLGLHVSKKTIKRDLWMLMNVGIVTQDKRPQRFKFVGGEFWQSIGRIADDGPTIAA